jgi:hypothetical protein
MNYFSTSSSYESNEPPVKKTRISKSLSGVEAINQMGGIISTIRRADRNEFFVTALQLICEEISKTANDPRSNAAAKNTPLLAAVEVLWTLGGGDKRGPNSRLSTQSVTSVSSNPPTDPLLSCNEDDGNDTESENETGIHVLISKILQYRTRGAFLRKIIAFQNGIVSAIRSSNTLIEEVCKLKDNDPNIVAIQRAFSLLANDISHGVYVKNYREPGRIGDALRKLKLTSPQKPLMPNIKNREHAAQYRSELEQEVFQVVRSGSKSIQEGCACEVYVSGINKWCPGRVTKVVYEDDGELIKINARVWKTGNDDSEIIEDLERRSINVRQLPPQKLDQASCAWLVPSFIMKMVRKLNMWGDRLGRKRVVVYLYDGSGMIKSERHNHRDITLGGQLFLSGKYNDGSLYNFIIGCIITNKDSRRIFDAWIAPQCKRWRQLYEEDEYESVTRIAVLDLKAWYDASGCTLPRHLDHSCDNPVNNAPKLLGQLYDFVLHRLVTMAVPNHTEAFMKAVLDNAENAKKYFNVNGPWILPMPVENTHHDPLHYGRWCCQVLGNILLGAYAAGGEPLMTKMLDHIRGCCGVELHNHHGVQVSAKGKVTVTTRKGVGAVMRVCAHINLVFNMRCEVCQMKWPEEHKNILEALNIYIIVVQMIIVPWLQYDMEKQKEYVKEAIVLIDIKICIECEIIGPWINKISGRIHATSGPRLARQLTEKGIYLPAVSAKPVEASHPPVWRGCHGAGANLGGNRCTVKSNEAATKRVICGMASDLIEARKSAARREEQKKKRELKKNKDQWDPFMARNKYLVDILTEGTKSIFDEHVWKEAQNIAQPGTFVITNNEDNDLTGGVGAQGDEGANENEDDIQDLNQEDNVEEVNEEINYLEWASRHYGGANKSLEYDSIQRASESSKILLNVTFNGSKGILKYPLSLQFTVGEGENENVITIVQLGQKMQSCELWSSRGGGKLNVLIVQARLDRAKMKVHKLNYGIQVDASIVRIWFLDESTSTLYINLHTRAA